MGPHAVGPKSPIFMSKYLKTPILGIWHHHISVIFCLCDLKIHLQTSLMEYTSEHKYQPERIWFG